ncbi:expansin EXLX1 family cellulose-binding protein [Dactylosporangium aurantiacum]|uniref:expansin EXLX1 family cellulose-binding protein n=1 Tax=Dactylosporangium aurantiacum TaxID=35754 RepID=UPI000B1C7343|nr:expansin EXLX1 family cellulose-binding protein [Dactylosporangium aurantiacum]MDG6107892.1 expansin EXLX1 family cellulose-binding protein [Dactylosporangium aurantiacum]
MLDNPEPPPWWLRRRTWVVAAAGAVVAGTATVALVAQASGAACAAPAVSSGQATYYAADGGGNCSFDQVANPMVVALGNAEYAAGAACGGYLDVKGPKGTVRVKVTDRCPECAPGHLDLSRQAFAKIGDPVAGIIKVTYSRVVNPPVPGPVTVRVKEGSSRYWLALRLDNTGNPLSTVEIQAGGGWKALSHTDYNYWIAQNGAGTGPFTIRATDTAGRRTTLTGVTLTVGTVQRPGATATSVAPKTPAASRSVTATASATATASGPAVSDSSDAAAGADGPATTAAAQPPKRCG